MTTVDALAGHLTLAPGQADALRCSRPAIGAALMGRLAAGRRALLLPELLGSVFTLCAAAQRATARRAVAAALGLRSERAPRPTRVVRPPRGSSSPAEPDLLESAKEAPALALATAREHLQRLALDLPRAVPLPGLLPDTAWLRDAPLQRAGDPASAAAALASWLERRLFAMPPHAWLQAWRADPAHWLKRWANAHGHVAARWLAAVRPRAEAIVLPCRPLALLDESDGGEAALREVAAALVADPAFPERPLWRGLPAETGPWTRHAHRHADLRPDTAWLRLGARLADLAAIACGEPLAFGALALAPGEAIAWTEMSRGLLLHWLQLEDAAADAATARAAAYRVLAPTEWNFHPQGALAEALRAGRLDARDARIAAAALDPCVSFEVAGDA